MSITDELREYVIGADGMGMTHGHAKSIYAIADRIDEGAKDNELFRREAGPFCDRLRDAAAERADVTLFGVDYTALPLDADGVPIRVGDMVEDAGVREIIERVIQIRYTLATSSKTPTVLTSVITDASQLPQKPNSYRHHHAPTVGDVLREFADEVQRCCDTADTIADYAKRLRLAEEVDE